MAYADIESRGLDAFDNVTFAHVDLGVRLHLAGGRRRWVPYGDLALTFWPVRDVVKNGERSAERQIEGLRDAVRPSSVNRHRLHGHPTFSAGGGLAIHMSETWALDVNVMAGQGTFKDVPLGNIPAGGTGRHSRARLDLDATSVRLNVGFSWWP